MGRFWKGLAVVGIGLFGLMLAVLFLLAGLGYGGLMFLLVLGAAYTWMIFAFVHYRLCRQEELVGVLTAAVDASAPLAPALWAYLRDRPHDGLREFWVALLLNAVVPGYYWLWYRRSNFDHKVAQVAHLLEEGHSLYQALRGTPGAASRTTQLAALLGEQTGQMATSLRVFRSPARGLLATAWVEVVPRLAYPLLLLLFVAGILSFWSTFLLPKFERIFGEMGVELPVETDRVITIAAFADDWGWVLGLAVPTLAFLLAGLLLSPGFRWYFPIVGFFYRIHIRSEILQALALLLQTNTPAPAGLAMLADCAALPGGARRRLRAVRRRVERGEPLADSLRRGRIVRRTMVPLLHTAQRAGSLPWALAELSDVLARQAARRVRGLSLTLFPVSIVGIGFVVALVVLGMYVPLISLIEGLGQ